MRKMVVAVSGGVDSVVLLDILVKNVQKIGNSNKGLYHQMNNFEDIMTKSGSFEVDLSHETHNIIVAHFDHGIRENSGADAKFVRELAERYRLEYAEEKAELTKEASEAEAREKRYAFLRTVAGLEGEIYTAHHLDDLVETVVINFLRGTGWRGLACLDTAGVRRPLLEAEEIYEPMDKAAIYEYAAKLRLNFREDQTNASERYLRNRVRNKLADVEVDGGLDFEEKLRLWKLWQKQKRIKREIDALVTGLLPEEGAEWQRAWFRELDTDELGRKAALELLRAGLLRVGVTATRPQLERFRKAILDYPPGKKFNLPGDVLVRLDKNSFQL